MSLKFNAKTHRYWLDGKSVPGVTTLLGKGLPKPALPNWAAKSVAEYVAANPEGVEALRAMGQGPMVAALKQVPWEKRDEAAIRGTEIHALAEELVNGREVEVPDRLLALVEGHARFLDAFGVEPILTEQSVASRQWRYAGRFDCIAKLSDGATWLLDWKSSKGVYGETALQTAAYARAEFTVTDDDPDTEMALPQVERIGVVHVTDAGSRLYDLGDLETAYRLWLHVAHVAQRVDTLRDLIGDPLPEPTKEPAA